MRHAVLQGLLLYVAKAAGSPPGPPRALGPLDAYELDVDALLQVALPPGSG